MIKSVSIHTRGPDKSKFTVQELALIDIEGLQRDFLKITFTNPPDKFPSKQQEQVYTFIRDCARLQYRLPVKYLKPIANSFSYVAQKSHIVGADKNVKNAGITVEPLNKDINHVISYTPINQSIPIGTVVTIDVSTDFESPTAERKFIWSSNLRTTSDIENKIKSANPKSVFIRPWLDKCHYAAIDIGSQLTGKYEVASVDTELIKSFALFGFARCDDLGEFQIWTYRCYNLTPVDILKMIADHDLVEDDTKELIKEVLAKVK